MSDIFACDECGKEGRRQFMAMVPEGWLYGESRVAETDEIVVVGVCSEGCRDSFFRPGPGRITVDSEKEPR